MLSRFICFSVKVKEKVEYYSDRENQEVVGDFMVEAFVIESIKSTKHQYEDELHHLH